MISKIKYILIGIIFLSNTYAEDFDNVGLLIGNPSTSFSKALITLDTIERVVDEAGSFCKILRQATYQ